MTLAEKIIFLENDIDKLNLAIYQQNKKITDLEKTLQLLYNKLQDTDNNPISKNDIPPHF